MTSEIVDDSKRATVVYLAGVPRDAVPGTDHHLSSALSVHHDVIWVDPPGSSLAEWRAAGRVPPPIRVERLTSWLVRIRTSVLAGPARPGVRTVAARLEACAVQFALRGARRPALATIVSSPEPRSARWCPRPLVYYATDDFVAGARLIHMDPTRLKAAEQEHLRDSDVVLAVSEQLAARLRAIRPDTRVLPNGCDATFYREHASDTPVVSRMDGPVAGVIGQLSDRLSLDVLEAVVQRGCRLLLVGPRIPGDSDRRWMRLLSDDNVEWLGQVAPSALPSVTARMTVGLVPYADTDFNRASFPLKTLEYLAAGLPVVCTDLPAVRALRAPGITVTSRPDAFAHAVWLRLEAGRGTEAEGDGRRAFAAEHDWLRRADNLLAVVDQRRHHE